MTPDRLDWTMLVARTKAALRSNSKRWEKAWGLVMTFEDWFVSEGYATWDDAFEVAEEAWDYQQERIKLLEKRVIDLQGHDDLRYIDKQLRKREWIGLTDDEVEEAFSFPFHYRSFYKAVEARLKEKNT